MQLLQLYVYPFFFVGVYNFWFFNYFVVFKLIMPSKIISGFIIWIIYDLNLPYKASTIEKNYLKLNNIVSSNRLYVINGTDELESVNDLQSKIEASNHNCILLGNDFLQTVNNYFTI